MTIAALLCVVLFLAWSWWGLFRQVIPAYFIDMQCRITQDTFIDRSHDPQALALRLHFLMDYYDERGKGLVGSRLERMVQREYQQTLTNAVGAFRKMTTNDLGGDPRAWIKKYEP